MKLFVGILVTPLCSYFLLWGELPGSWCVELYPVVSLIYLFSVDLWIFLLRLAHLTQPQESRQRGALLWRDVSCVQLVSPLLTQDECCLISDRALMICLETLLLKMTNSSWLSIFRHSLCISKQRCILGRIWYMWRL